MEEKNNQPNRQAFFEQLPALRAKFPTGYYALFAGATLIGAYATYSAALAEGYSQAGKAPFFVKQIQSVDEDVQCVVTPFTVV